MDILAYFSTKTLAQVVEIFCHLKDKDLFTCIINTMVDTDLAIPGAIALTAVVLTTQNISVSAPQKLTNLDWISVSIM